MGGNEQWEKKKDGRKQICRVRNFKIKQEIGEQNVYTDQLSIKVIYAKPLKGVLVIKLTVATFLQRQ